MSGAVIRAGALLAALALSGCSAGQVAKGAAQAALGGGPNVAANVQAGQTNAQTFGASRSAAPVLRDVTADHIRQSVDENRVSADRVERVVVNEVPAWVILLALVGWLLPSPGEIGRALAHRIGWT